jgi:transposase, IS5 family
VLRTVNAQPTLWEAILPAECLVLPGDLAAVDRLLVDERFFEPFMAYFDATFGRPSIPIETYLRMMFLKHRYQLGFEPLCAEVSDSIAWRRFCRVPLGTRAPHPTTLMKITKRCGPELVGKLNETLLVKAHEAQVVNLERVRADTTVIEANIKYPTDSSLLTRAVARLSRLTARIHATGAAARTVVVDRSAEAQAHAHSIGAWLRRRSGEAKDEVLRITGEVADLADVTAAETERVVINARRWLAAHPEAPKRGRLARMIDDLETLTATTNQVIVQTRARVGGVMPAGATRLVSLHEPDARPISKGRLGRPVEFGYKAQIVDNVDGIVVDHNVEIGNPPDGPQLEPAIARIAARAGHAPTAVTADRGYGYARVDKALTELGVGDVVIPRAGKPGAERSQLQISEPFLELVKWRTGSEGRISSLKRDYGLRRTRLVGHTGARIWVGHGVLAHNLTKIARLTA